MAQSWWDSDLLSELSLGSCFSRRPEPRRSEAVAPIKPPSSREALPPMRDPRMPARQAESTVLRMRERDGRFATAARPECRTTSVASSGSMAAPPFVRREARDPYVRSTHHAPVLRPRGESDSHVSQRSAAAAHRCASASAGGGGGGVGGGAG